MPHDRPKSTETQESPRGGTSAPRSGSRSRSVVRAAVGFLRRRGPRSGPLRDAALPSRRPRSHQRGRSAFRGEPSDILQPTGEVLGRRHRGTPCKAAGAQGSSKVDCGCLELCARTPGQRGGALDAWFAGRDSSKVWRCLSPTHTREARERSSLKKKRWSLISKPQDHSASKRIAPRRVMNGFAAVAWMDRKTRSAPPGNGSRGLGWQVSSIRTRIEATWWRSMVRGLPGGDESTHARWHFETPYAWSSALRPRWPLDEFSP